MTIYFYSTREKPYGCFSNFSRHGFELDGAWWATSEHYFQAQKFVDTDRAWFEKIREVKTPKEAAKMGRDRSHPCVVIGNRSKMKSCNTACCISLKLMLTFARYFLLQVMN